MKISNAELGRSATSAVATAAGDRYESMHYVNKTPKYLSVKITLTYLTPEQIEEVTQRLSQQYPDRFLKVYNSTAVVSERGQEWREPKVLVRFTQN